MWIFIVIFVLIIGALAVFLFFDKIIHKKNHSLACTETDIKISESRHAIDELCVFQMQILAAFCFAEKESKANRTLIFEFFNSNTNTRLFFYEENLNPNRQSENDADILQKVKNYQIHLELEQQKIIFWQKIAPLRQAINPDEKILTSQYYDLEYQYKNANEIEQFQTWLSELKKLC